MNKKVIPIGISDFKEFFNYNYYYIDKSFLIKNILDNRSKVTLFTRPRRFGKTLNLSMMKYFFEKTQEDNSYLFKDLDIWNAGEKYKEYQGKYPVINLTFKDTKMNNWEETYEKLINIIAEEYKRHEYLEDIIEDKNNKQIFQDIKAKKASFTEYTSSIKKLCVYMEMYYKQRPILLIDEYDVPLQNSYIQGFYNETINFIRSLLQEALKDNNSLEFAIITGCLRISKESIFTGLNNLDINSILDKQYSEHFGFTQSEVDEMIKYYELEKKREEIKDWYDGYQFGAKDIYNPWSVLKCVKDMTIDTEKKPEAYWVNTSGNDIVRRLVKVADSKTRIEIEELISGKTIEKILNPNIIYNDIEKDINNIWSMLFFTGYLTYTKERREEGDVISYYSLKIPNKELLYIYEIVIKNWFEEIVKKKNMKPLYESIIRGDTEIVTKEINSLLIKSISVYDKKESFYHGFLLGLLQNIEGYRVKSNRESGNGRSDIILIPYIREQTAVIIEIKVSKKYREINKKIEEAIKQIENKDYDTYLKKRGFNNIIKYGMAFYSKRCLAKKSG